MTPAITLPQLPDPSTVSMALFFLLTGMAVPTRYGIERLNGFGRAMVSRLPYQPPPGKDEETALQEAVDED